MAAQLLAGALSHLQLHIAGAQTMLQHFDCRALFTQPAFDGSSGSNCGAASSSTHESHPLTELMEMHPLKQILPHAQQQQRRQQQLPYQQRFKRQLPAPSLAQQQQVQLQEDELDSPPLPFSRPLQRGARLQSWSPPALPVAAAKAIDDADAAWESQKPAPEPLGQQLSAEDLASLKSWLSTPSRTEAQEPQVDTRSSSDSSDASCSSSDESSSSEDEAAETAAAELTLHQLPRQQEVAVQASIALAPVYSTELSGVHLPQLGRTTLEHYAALGRLSSDSQGVHDDAVLFMSRPQLRGATCATGLITQPTPTTSIPCADGGSQANSEASSPLSGVAVGTHANADADVAPRLYDSQQRTIAAADDGALTSSTASTAAWLSRWKAKQRKARRGLQLAVNSKASISSSSSSSSSFSSSSSSSAAGAAPFVPSSPLSASEWTMLGW
jgi:hypothetical protein